MSEVWVSPLTGVECGERHRAFKDEYSHCGSPKNLSAQSLPQKYRQLAPAPFPAWRKGAAGATFKTTTKSAIFTAFWSLGEPPKASQAFLSVVYKSASAGPSPSTCPAGHTPAPAADDGVLRIAGLRGRLRGGGAAPAGGRHRGPRARQEEAEGARRPLPVHQRPRQPRPGLHRHPVQHSPQPGLEGESQTWFPVTYNILIKEDTNE